MLYQAAGRNATRVSFQFRVSNAPTTAWVRSTWRGRPQVWRGSVFGTIDRGVIKGVEGRANE
jgi:hypothetical protein